MTKKQIKNEYINYALDLFNEYIKEQKLDEFEELLDFYYEPNFKSYWNDGSGMAYRGDDKEAYKDFQLVINYENGKVTWKEN